MKYLYSALLLLFLLIPVHAQGWQPQLWDITRQPLQKKFLKNFDQTIQRLQISASHQAQPIHGEGLLNVYRVSPMLYRGGQPTEEGYRTLAKMGIKTIISLRTKAPDEELLQELGITSYHIPINPFLFNDAHAREFLRVLQHAPGPIYIHCLYGSDRTGIMVALYRLVYQHWGRKDALREMRDKRFGFHKAFANLPYYIENVQFQNIMPYSTTAMALSSYPETKPRE